MVKSKVYWGHLWGQQGRNHEFRRLMLKIKIPPRSKPAKPDDEPAQPESDKSSTSLFWSWWQREFEEPDDFLEYDAGLLNSARELAEAVENYVWPDFMVGAEGTWVVFRRDREKYFPRKKKAEPDQVNGKDQDQEIIPETMTL